METDTCNWVSSNSSTNIKDTTLLNSTAPIRLSLNNIASSTATIVMVDGRWDHELLLKGVEILSDHNLSINQAHISSNGDGSFRDVYHVTDQDGDKLTKNATAIIEQAMKSGLSTKRLMSSSKRNITTLELMGTNRDGLMADVFAILNNFHCNVVDAKLRALGGRVACLVDVAGGLTYHQDLQARLRDVLGQGGRVAICSRPSSSLHGSERRLHRMMMGVEGAAAAAGFARASSGAVTVKEWWERGNPVVRVECKDRVRLLLDVLCTVHELGYFVFHGKIRTNESWASQKFYIKHAEGKSVIISEDETQRLVQCVEAAIDIRSSPGIRVEMCSGDRQGLLADLTQSFKENEWSVTGADVTTPDGMAKNVFYLTPHAEENPVRQEAVEAVRQKVGLANLKLKEVTFLYPATAALAKMAAKSASSLKKFMWRRNNPAVTSNVELIGSS